MLDLSQNYLIKLTNSANQIEDHITTPISYNEAKDIYCVSASGVGTVLFVGESDLLEDTTAGGFDLTSNYYIDIEDKTYICKILFYNESTQLFCISPAGIGYTLFVEGSKLTEV